jgi:hypothetical protein
MLTIENFQRLKGKVIGGTGYYVNDIKPIVAQDMNTKVDSYLYLIELTNRKQFLLISLSREGFATGRRMKLYELKLGQDYINLTKFQLRNMDMVVDRLNKLVLEQYVP